MAAILGQSVCNGLFYYAEKGVEKCFQDLVVKNNTLEMEVQILDDKILKKIADINKELE